MKYSSMLRNIALNIAIEVGTVILGEFIYRTIRNKFLKG